MDELHKIKLTEDDAEMWRNNFEVGACSRLLVYFRIFLIETRIFITDFIICGTSGTVEAAREAVRVPTTPGAIYQA